MNLHSTFSSKLNIHYYALLIAAQLEGKLWYTYVKVGAESPSVQICKNIKLLSYTEVETAASC